MGWLNKLLSGDESEVDSVIVFGAFALFALIGLTVYVVLQSPMTWSPITFGTGAVTIIGSMAGGKTARDRWSAPSQGSTTDDAKPH